MNASSRLREKSIPFEVKLKRLIASMHLNCIGIVADVNNDGSRIDVNLPYLDCNNKPVTIKGIEVLHPGTNLVKVKIKPEVGDVVMLFAQQEYWAEVTFNALPKKKDINSEPYNDNTIKALLVQTNETNEDATNIEVTDKEINIKTPLKVNVTVDDNEATVTCNKLTINDHLTVE